MKILYARIVQGSGSGDGGEIYDDKLIGGLRQYFEVEVLTITRKRRWLMPLWASAVPSSVFDRVSDARSRAQYVIISHEHIFSLATKIDVNLLIVHNYLPCFCFRGHRWLEGYFRLGAKRYFRRAFESADALLFLSNRDFRRAAIDFPTARGKSVMLQPPPFQANLLPRRMNLIHISGSDGWLPKRLCRLTSNDREAIKKSDFALGDFGAQISPAFGLITDRFRVGFKLKLMQMLYVGDVIASLCDLQEEVDALVPGYPFYRSFSRLEEAIEYFQDVRNKYTAADIDKVLEPYLSAWDVPAWHGLAARLIEKGLHGAGSYL